jgi:hypothetical protein
MSRLMVIVGLLVVLVGSVTPGIVSAQEATPDPVVAGGLASMLQLAPDVGSSALKVRRGSKAGVTARQCDRPVSPSAEVPHGHRDCPLHSALTAR